MSRRVPRDDHADAERIVDAVARGGGELVGALSVARAVGGFPLGRASDRRRAVQRIYDLMGLAVELSVDMCPDQVLIVNPDHTYKMISALDPAAMTTIRARWRKSRTAEARVHRELSVGKTPAQQALAAIVGQRIGMSPAIEYLFKQIAQEQQEQA